MRIKLNPQNGATPDRFFTLFISEVEILVVVASFLGRTYIKEIE